MQTFATPFTPTFGSYPTYPTYPGTFGPTNNHTNGWFPGNPYNTFAPQTTPANFNATPPFGNPWGQNAYGNYATQTLPFAQQTPIGVNPFNPWAAFPNTPWSSNWNTPLQTFTPYSPYTGTPYVFGGTPTVYGGYTGIPNAYAPVNPYFASSPFTNPLNTFPTNLPFLNYGAFPTIPTPLFTPPGYFPGAFPVGTPWTNTTGFNTAFPYAPNTTGYATPLYGQPIQTLNNGFPIFNANPSVTTGIPGYTNLGQPFITPGAHSPVGTPIQIDGTEATGQKRHAVSRSCA